MSGAPILIVEDDEGIRTALRLMLEFFGYDVVTASNGREALDLLPTITPGLILLDLMMPVMDGWAFATEVSSDPAFARVPIVVLTAFPDRVAPDNVAEVVAKPVDVDRLMGVVERFVGGRA